MQERIIYRNCPLCSSNKFEKSRVGNCSRHPAYDRLLSSEIAWNDCHNCGHSFTEGYYSDEACRLIYSKTNDNQKVGDQLEKNRILSAGMIDKVLPYASSGIWLDIGFGNGSLLFTAEEYGFTPIGVDLRAENVTQLRALGIEAHCADISKLTLAKKCSIISMMDVLEHMPFPKIGLASAHGLVKKGGVLFLSMPNTENVVWRTMNRKNINPYWGEMEHYHNFGRSRLYALLEEAGFQPMQYGVSQRYRACMEIIAIKK